MQLKKLQKKVKMTAEKNIEKISKNFLFSCNWLRNDDNGFCDNSNRTIQTNKISAGAVYPQGRPHFSFVAVITTPAGLL